LRQEIAGIVLLVGSLFLAGALIFGRTPAPAEACATSGGAFGPVGGCLRWTILSLVGGLAAIVVPCIPAIRGLRLLGRIGHPTQSRIDLFPIGLVLIVPVAAGLARLDAVPQGTADTVTGLWGALAGFYLAEALGRGGAWFVIVTAVSVLTAATVAWNPIKSLVSVKLPTPRPKSVAPEPITTAEAMEPSAAEMPAVDLSLMGLALPATAEAAVVSPAMVLVPEPEEMLADPAMDEPSQPRRRGAGRPATRRPPQMNQRRWNPSVRRPSGRRAAPMRSPRSTLMNSRVSTSSPQASSGM
jgi:hypothetical protein